MMLFTTEGSKMYPYVGGSPSSALLLSSGGTESAQGLWFQAMTSDVWKLACIIQRTIGYFNKAKIGGTYGGT